MFVQQGEYQEWTNTFARSSIQWDEKNGLLENEKGRVNSVKKLEKYPERCCGNSPGRKPNTWKQPEYSGWDPERDSSRTPSPVRISSTIPSTAVKPRGSKSKAKKGRATKSACKTRQMRVPMQPKSRPQSSGTNRKRIPKRQKIVVRNEQS